jgi:hypothetical protein
VQIYYCGLNFQNVILATGKLAANVFIEDRLNQVRTQTQFCQNTVACKNMFHHLPFLPTDLA